MQDIVFYVAAKETHGIVRDSANANNLSAPNLVLGVSVCLKMRLFAACNVATAYPVASFSGISGWNWRMDADFERDTPNKLIADADDIFVHTVTETVDGETVTFTEFVIPISDMNTQELATWLGNEKKRSGLVGELVGYDTHENAVFVLQIEDFTIRNRIAGLGDPTAIEQEVATRSQTAQMIQAAVSSSAATKQDKLTSANAGTNISIDENGIISNTYSLPAATTGSKGGVMLATTAETISGSNATKAITPAAFTSALSGDDPIIAKSAIRAFQPITELGSASAASLKSGGAYRLSAISGNHYLTVPDVPADKFGMDAHLELFVGKSSLIHVSDPLILMDALIPNAVNDCVIKFRDGTARMFVEDHAYGYVVTVAGGTSGTQLDGSLHYGLTEAANSYISFANSLNGQTVVLPEAATVSRAVNVVGNGYTQTVISGSVSCAAQTTFSNLGMQDVSVLGGTMTLGDVYIPSGSTLNGSSGTVLIERVTGGGTIDLGGPVARITDGATMSGITLKGGTSGATYGAIQVSSSTINAISCTFTSNGKSGDYGGVFQGDDSGYINLSACVFSANVGDAANVFLNAGASCAIVDCSFSDGSIWAFGGNTVISMGGSNYGINAAGSGSAVLQDGAVVDLTGTNNSIGLTGGIKFPASATILTGATVGVVDAQFALGNITVPTIENSNVVNLSGYTNEIKSGVSAHAENCTITGGTGGSNYGAFKVNSDAVFSATSCNFVSNGNSSAFGGVFQIQGGALYVSSCTFSGTVGADIFVNTGGSCTLVDCSFPDGRVYLYGSTTVADFAGRNVIRRLDGAGTVNISSGAILDIAGSDRPAPVNATGGVVLQGGPNTALTTIIYSSGSATDSRTFEDLKIRGASISKLGLIYGATVYSDEGDDHEVSYTEDDDATSVTVIVTGQTTFAVPGGLVKISNT